MMPKLDFNSYLNDFSFKMTIIKIFDVHHHRSHNHLHTTASPSKNYSIIRIYKGRNTFKDKQDVNGIVINKTKNYRVKVFAWLSWLKNKYYLYQTKFIYRNIKSVEQTGLIFIEFIFTSICGNFTDSLTSAAQQIATLQRLTGNKAKYVLRLGFLFKITEWKKEFRLLRMKLIQ